MNPVVEALVATGFVFTVILVAVALLRSTAKRQDAERRRSLRWEVLRADRRLHDLTNSALAQMLAEVRREQGRGEA